MRATFTHLLGPDKGKRELFEVDKISIGRAPNNALSFGDGARRVSSHHAEVVRRGDQYVLHDLGSTNGTMVNGRRVIASEIHQDDLIEFGAGGPLLRFGVESDGASAAGEINQGEALQPPNAARAIQQGASETPTGPTASARKTNLKLIAAIVLAMMSGAAGGILYSSRLPAPDDRLLSFGEVAELNVPAVVFIRAEFELLNEMGQVVGTDAQTGSGFVISPDGLIVTNRHLIRHWEYGEPQQQGAAGRVTKIDVILPGQKEDGAVAAEIYRMSEGELPDVAILKINSSRLRFVHGIEADLNKTGQGDEVVVLGYPLGLNLLEITKDDRVKPSLFTGIVSRVGQDSIQLSLRAYHGNSGGPVLNRRGEVIGILTANLRAAQDITLCTPVSEAIRLITETKGGSNHD
ncbi:MAG TPA: trypsin-like peptidase domain-containing protein [Blastocatellia bacterium]|jgi:S1-C subfamily serine protease|nr:trypsin-like peptidase domain-containing protein [Blastocatellia bacterium]